MDITPRERAYARRISTENTKFVPIGNDTYRVIGVDRPVMTKRYVSSARPERED